MNPVERIGPHIYATVSGSRIGLITDDHRNEPCIWLDAQTLRELVKLCPGYDEPQSIHEN